MTRCLIELPYENRKQAGERAIQVFRESSSRFMTNVDWGCADGEPNSWVVVDPESDEQARCIVPPYLEQAVVITPQQFGPDPLNQTRDVHAACNLRPRQIQ